MPAVSGNPGVEELKRLSRMPSNKTWHAPRLEGCQVVSQFVLSDRHNRWWVRTRQSTLCGRYNATVSTGCIRLSLVFTLPSPTLPRQLKPSVFHLQCVRITIDRSSQVYDVA